MIADRFDAFVFDLDGAVYVGEEPTPGAVEILERLRDRGATIRFLTNNPRATRRQVADRLEAMGIAVTVEEIVIAGWAAAEYSVEQGAETAAMVGSDGLAAEIESAGLQFVDSNPDVVIVGAAEDTDYGDIRRAARFIRAGVPFVATNPDASYPTPDGPAPGTGAIVRAVEVASGVRPTVVGKPDPRMFEVALEGIDADAVVVGDNPETDVLGAHRAGLPAVLVGDRKSPAAAGDFRSPDATVPDLRGLFDPDVAIGDWQRPGYDWPEMIVATVAAVVCDGPGRVLLVPGAGGWTLPAGDVGRAETVAEAARRLLRDRAGLDATPAGLVGVYSEPAEQIRIRADGATVQQVTTCLAFAVEGTQPDGEASFFDSGALPEDLDPFAKTVLDDAHSDGGLVVR